MKDRGGKPAGHRNAQVPMATTWLVLVLLLIAPGLALARLGSSASGILLVVSAVVSLLTALLYRTDKSAAEAGRPRIRESTLHTLELLGGWPAAFLAQRIWRHKTVKLSYQVTFWLIVAAHEFLAADYLLDGRLHRSLWS